MDRREIAGASEYMLQGPPYGRSWLHPVQAYFQLHEPPDEALLLSAKTVCILLPDSIRDHCRSGEVYRVEIEADGHPILHLLRSRVRIGIHFGRARAPICILSSYLTRSGALKTQLMDQSRFS